MPWLRLEDKFTRHPKVRGLSDKAFRVHVDVLCQAAEWLTDGRIPPDFTRRTAIVSELETAGLWDRNGAGWVIHDWSDYNPTAAEATTNRSRSKAGKSTGGSIGNHRRWHAARGVTSADCQWCQPR